MCDSDLDILNRACEYEDFCGSVVRENGIEDWELARRIGDMFVSLCPEDPFGYLAIARACRHFGERGAAARALAEFRGLEESGIVREVAPYTVAEIERERSLVT